MTASDAPEDVEGSENELHRMLEEADAASRRDHDRTAVRLAREVARRARAERKLAPLLHANFRLMVNGTSLIDLETAKQAALDNIAFFESPERAREFDPSHDEDQFAHTAAWMTACSYDNLAKATAEERGQNSEGLQALISEGIQVCRRTNKLECVTCFREYATDVLTAADDLALAAEHARTNLEQTPRNAHDRRWVGAQHLSKLLRMNGQLGDAWNELCEGSRHIDTWHSPDAAKHLLAEYLDELRALMGDEVEGLHETPDREPDPIPEGENPTHDWRVARTAAIRDCAAGRHEDALKRLQEWDRELLRGNFLNTWFEARLRLIATLILAGHEDRIERLAVALEDKAKEAHDFLTLRRLRALRERPWPVSPAALGGPIDRGPWAASAAGDDDAAEVPTAEGAPTEGTGAVEDADTAPLPDPHEEELEVISALRQRLYAADESSVTEVHEEALAMLEPLAGEGITDAARAANWLSVVPAMVGPDALSQRLWALTEGLAGRTSEDPVVRTYRAWIGAQLHEMPAPFEAISTEEIADELRQAARDGSDIHWVQMIAGSVAIRRGDLDGAEPFCARAFRLRRDHPASAQDLAEIYRRTDRGREALAVLDLALRGGAPGFEIAFDAGQLAIQFGQHDAAVTYLDRAEELSEDHPWTQYHRARALLAGDRFEEAQEAIALQASREAAPHMPLSLASLRARAAHGLKEEAAAREHLEAAITARHADNTLLTAAGLTAAYEGLLGIGRDIGDEALLDALWQKALAGGYAPQAEFDRRRQAGEKAEDTHYFEVVLRQSFDRESWLASDVRPDESDGWTSYLVLYGVLAGDEEEARQLALAAHPAFDGTAPEVDRVTKEDATYSDHRGVFSQSSLHGEED